MIHGGEILIAYIIGYFIVQLFFALKDSDYFGKFIVCLIWPVLLVVIPHGYLLGFLQEKNIYIHFSFFVKENGFFGIRRGTNPAFRGRKFWCPLFEVAYWRKAKTGV
jgi:hypothetical protein